MLAGMVGWLATHGETVPVDRIEPSIGEPSLIEMQPVDGLPEKLFHPPDIIAEAVIGRVRNDSVHGGGVDTVTDQSVGSDGLLDRKRGEPFRTDRSDNSVAVALGHEISRDRPREGDRVLD